MSAPLPARRVNRPQRWSSASLRRGWVAGFVLLIACWAISEPIWMRPLVQRYVREHAGRRIDFDGLQLRLDADFQPVFRIHRLQVENASWASARPLITAEQVDVTLAWRSLRGHGTVLPLVVLGDADIDLEQQIDGLRNWRLADPQDRGPGRVRILSLQAVGSRLRMLDRARDLELQLAVTPMAASESLPARPTLPPMNQHLHIDGRYRQTPFEGDFSVSAVLTLFDTGADFPLRGRLRSGGSSLALEGTSHDLLQLGGFDVAAHLLSTDLVAAAGPLFGAVALPALKAEARARLRRQGDDWQLTDLHAHLGASDLAGSLDLLRPVGGGRSSVRAELVLQRVDLEELRRGYAGHRAAAAVATVADRVHPGPSRPVDRFDAEVELVVAKIDGLPLAGPLQAVDGLRTHASLQAGRLTLSPLSFTVAGGEASGRLSLDTTREPIAAALELGLKRLPMDRFAAAGSAKPGVEGNLDLQMALQSQGDSFAALRDSASGKVSASLHQATLPATLDARMALDAGQWLRAVVSPGKRVAVTCAIGEMQIDAGRGRTTRLAIETENVVLSGSAAVDLRTKSFELVLTPHRKQSALLALDKSIRLVGGFRHPKAGLVERDPASSRAGCQGGGPP